MKLVAVPGPILKETRPPASDAITFSLPSSELFPLPLLSCCAVSRSETEKTQHPVPKSGIKGGILKKIARTPQERHLFWVMLKQLSKFRVASTRRNYCRIKASAVQSCSLRKSFFFSRNGGKALKGFFSVHSSNPFSR